MLEKFKKAKIAEIKQLARLMEDGKFPVAKNRPDKKFAKTLRQRSNSIAIIAEYKRASPSRGIIRTDLEPEDVANAYALGGASALSVLTETDYFQGNFNYLDRCAKALAKISSLPILRKDFIFDELQIMATASSSASALLLIARLTPDAKMLCSLRELAESYNLECVVEIFDLQDLKLARDSGAEIIQVNARDLASLKVDCTSCLRLIEAAKPQMHELWICASGLESGLQIKAAASAGFGAALIGSSLMSKPDPGVALATLIEESKCC